MSNINLSTVTNLDAEMFLIEKGGTYTDAIKAARTEIGLSPAEVPLYSFNVKTGAAKCEVYRMPNSKIKPTFGAALAEAWYEIQYANAFVISETIPAITADMPADEKKAINVLNKRIEAVKSVRNEHRGKHNPCKTVKNLAHAFAGSRESCFSEDVRDAYKAVKSELVKMRTSNSTTLTSKEFKNLVTNVTKSMWDESQHCEYAFMKCHTAHAKQIYQLDYSGLRYNSKTKDFQPTYNKDGTLMTEIIRRAWQRILEGDCESTAPIPTDNDNDSKTTHAKDGNK